VNQAAEFKEFIFRIIENHRI